MIELLPVQSLHRCFKCVSVKALRAFRSKASSVAFRGLNISQLPCNWF